MTVMLFRQKYGNNYSAMLSPWNADEVVFVPVDAENIVFDEDEGIVDVTIRLRMPEDADYGVIEEFEEGAEEEEEEEEEERPRRRKGRKRRR